MDQPSLSPWRFLERIHVHRSPWRNFVIERVETHRQVEMAYHYMEAPDAVFVVPLRADGKIVLLRQYRLPVHDWVWEIPAGSIDDESPDDAARRELREEIGGTCGELQPLGCYYGLPAATTTRDHLYLALGVTLGPHQHEPTELIEVVAVDPNQAFTWARTGQIASAECALAILLSEATIRQQLAR